MSGFDVYYEPDFWPKPLYFIFTLGVIVFLVFVAARLTQRPDLPVRVQDSVLEDRLRDAYNRGYEDGYHKATEDFSCPGR